MESLIENLFIDEVRRDAYHFFVNAIPSIIKPAVRNKSGRSDFLMIVEHLILRDTPAIKIVVTDIVNVGAVFICFDSDWAPYSIGQTSLGLGQNLTALSCRGSALLEVERQLTDIIRHWI